MKEDRWQKISRLYHAARELPVNERATFLSACTDEDLRREVSSLLENEDKAKSFFSTPALDIAARMEAGKQSSLLGKQLGSYELTSELGRGGMGEVYRAKDLKLGRDVAIKVLPEEFADDADRQARFRREAKLLASLNHPNIAAIHGLEESGGTQFLVLELVEGETLCDTITRGPIPVEEALKLSLQIAEALEAAHEKGVMHRDLKPANIKITLDRKVKVLDFGLAKVFSTDQSDVSVSDSSTRSVTATQKGIIIGTAPYMSPEQAQGQKVDKRTDIWAFGCVLYEMLTGQTAFSGKNVTDILAAVIRAEPEWQQLPANLHWRIREVLDSCLEKESTNRYHDIADIRRDIQKVLADPGGLFAQRVVGAEPKRSLRTMLPWLAAAVVLTAVISGVFVWNLRPPGLRQVIRFDCEIPEGQRFSNPAFVGLAVSPDGTKFAYSTTEGLYLRSMDDMNARLISGTNDNPMQPFFSPDGNWIGYFAANERKLKKVSINGGAPTELCAVQILTGATWYADDTILYSELFKIMRISAGGGNPELVLEEESRKIGGAQILPDGKSLLFTIEENKERKAAVQSQSGEIKELIPGEYFRYLSTGHLLFAREDSLYSVPFDLNALDAIGAPVPLVGDAYGQQFVVSEAGTLVYVPGRMREVGRTLVWVDREGREEPLSAGGKAYTSPRISPDGTRIAVSFEASGNADIQIWDLVKEFWDRLTFDKAIDCIPVWSPDGDRIFFASNRDGTYAVYWKAADGSGEDEFLKSVPDRSIFPWAWSKNGKTLVLQEMVPAEQDPDVGLLSMEGGLAHKPLFEEDCREGQPKISPNGLWIAYLSDESGRNEVYVRPFPEVNKGRWQISENGGDSPLWSPDGRELYYRNGDSVIAVSVQTEPVFKRLKQEVLFQGTYVSISMQDVHTWDIGPDGRFLMMKPSVATEGESTAETPRKINVVFNWFEEMKKKVPVP